MCFFLSSVVLRIRIARGDGFELMSAARLPEVCLDQLCTLDCGDHGTCQGGVCMCQQGWTGENCKEPVPWRSSCSRATVREQLRSEEGCRQKGPALSHEGALLPSEDISARVAGLRPRLLRPRALHLRVPGRAGAVPLRVRLRRRGLRAPGGLRPPKHEPLVLISPLLHGH